MGCTTCGQDVARRYPRCPPSRQGLAIRYYFLSVAMLLAALSIGLFVLRLRVHLAGRRAEGTVTGHETRRLGDLPSYHHIVSYADEAGRQQVFTANAGWGSPRPPVGAKVAVVHLAGQPAKAYISSVFHLWVAPALMALLSAGAMWTALQTG